jgi:hypothetical protein
MSRRPEDAVFAPPWAARAPRITRLPGAGALWSPLRVHCGLPYGVKNWNFAFGECKEFIGQLETCQFKLTPMRGSNVS